jgi:hypothetical protein
MSQDAADYEAQKAYEEFLNKLPRAERRRILKAHMKRIEKSLKKRAA